ncbi:MAG TPA: putative DNA-binding domain-containing protein [Gammaproteobacteria bacterium]|nr:putative DNA-binding domain-containing protein [Gammaproteobacteria bacterium]
MPSPASETPGFFRHQRAFTARLRDPEAEPGDDRGLAVYRELVFNNLESLLAATFPVLKATLGGDGWEALVRDFLHEHRCRTPLFPELSGELVTYLEGERGARPGDPPFLAELAHYEWVELELSLQDPPEADGLAAAGDLLEDVPVPSPLARVLSYRFPVHRIGPGYRPGQPPAEATHLVAHGDGEGEVAFLAVSAATACLLRRLDGGAITGAGAVSEVAADLGLRDPAELLPAGRAILADLRQRGVLLGVRKTN